MNVHALKFSDTSENIRGSAESPREREKERETKTQGE
jgi:hypothetical protein